MMAQWSAHQSHNCIVEGLNPVTQKSRPIKGFEIYLNSFVTNFRGPYLGPLIIFELRLNGVGSKIAFQNFSFYFFLSKMRLQITIRLERRKGRK